jgi:hypothetical protein
VPQYTRNGPARYGHPAAAPADDGARAGIHLTGRGAVVSLLALTFLGLLMAGWLNWGVLGDVVFVAACVVITCGTKRSDLLPVVVCPPLVFLIACVCAKVATSAGGTSALEGTLVTLGNSAPWLFAGTALTIVIGLGRGLLGALRDLRRGLHGDPSWREGREGSGEAAASSRRGPGSGRA